MYKIQKEDYDKIVSNYKQGETPSSISRRFQVSPKTIINLLTKLKVYNKISKDSYKNYINTSQYNYKIISKSDHTDTFKRVYLNCECNCGTLFVSNFNNIKVGNTKSCGCLNLTVGVKRKGEAALRKLYNSYVSGASKRNYSFELSLKEFESYIFKDCQYCGEKPSRKQFAYHRTVKTKGKSSDEFIIVNGIDRIDNTLGYSLQNCVPCCKKCNTIKMDMTKVEFLEHINKIIKYQKECKNV